MRKGNPKDLYYALLPTPWGPMGAVAGAQGLRRVILPHYRMKDLEELLTWEHPTAVRDDAPFERFIELASDYFSGKKVDFSEVPCELPSSDSFSGMVYRAAREIPYAQTLSYSALAYKIHRESAARAVATAMSKNPIPLVVPCHRVIYANGTPGGFSAEGGVALKQRMLELEERGKDHRGQA